MQTTFHDMTIDYPDRAEFLTLIDEIWKSHSYYLDLDTQTPFIIDAGAHIGLATLYFHEMYPGAQFVCIEPDPYNRSFLEKNLAHNLSPESYQIIPKALVWDDRTHTTLHSNTAHGILSSLHSGGWTGTQDTQEIVVESTTLTPLLDRAIDILKMDIEGAEFRVLQQVGGRLRAVSHAIIELHETHAGESAKLEQLLKPIFSTVSVTKDPRRERNTHHRLYRFQASK